MKGVYRQHIAVLALFSVLAICMTYPVVRSMGSRIAGTGGDPWQTMWRMETKSQGGAAVFSQDIAGSGEPRLANLSVWPWMPLHLLLGEPLAYNVIWLLQFILAGYAMALFVQILTRQEHLFAAAPVLSGIAYMFLPYHVAHALGHFGAMQAQWIPFICAAVLALVRSWKPRFAIILGVLLIIQAWTEHHYILWLALFGVVAIFFYRKEAIYSYKKHVRILLLIAAMVLGGIVVPFIPTIRLAATQGDAINLGLIQTIRFSADLFSFITPSVDHPVWGNASKIFFGRYFTGNAAESVQYFGISIILAILFFHRHIPVKQKRLWVSAIVVFGIISLGPVLHVFGRETIIPLPYALLAKLPVFSAIRVVARAGIMVGFAVVALFGWVVATNKHSWRTSVLIGLLLIIEFAFFPFPTQSAKLSPVYEALREVSQSAIIELPAATNYTAASRALYASAFHGKNVLGNIALERGQGPDAFDLERSVPAVRQLLFLRTTDLMERRSEFFGQDLQETFPDVLQWLDVGGIIVHTDSLDHAQNTAVSSFLRAEKTLQEESFQDASLYTRKADERAASDGIFLVRGDGWENVRRDDSKNIFADIPHTASITLVNLHTDPQAISLSFSLPRESVGKNIILTDAQGNMIEPTGIGDRIVYTQTVAPNTTKFSFSHSASEVITIVNPLLEVSAPSP